jgi:hypothetical protein
VDLARGGHLWWRNAYSALVAPTDTGEDRIMEKAWLLLGGLGLCAAPATAALPPIFRLQAQPDWLARELPPSAVRLLEQYPEVGVVLGIAKLLAKPLIFLAVLLLVGLLLGRLADRAILPARDRTEQYQRDEKTARHLAIGRLAVWLIALAIASEAAGLHWVLALLAPVLNFVGMVLIGIAVLLVGAFIALTAGGQGRELLLSILGSFYLQRRAKAPDQDPEFDLGDGVRGRIEKVELLHTTFVLPDGTREVRPNAWFMQTQLHWGGPAARPQPAAGAWAAGDGSAPSSPISHDP